ncbi:pyridoxal-phosphate-dependent aminotransferase family protein [Paraglaciecola arctica]|uniref:pyridoxal-phosphate-dependent aminotransferase family protein n=1 Tax=Paraglaciecola arctica TaxID=1128911 RepID=UPI001C077A57|nr:alanine--glyoxylate aminotransferase family protein [Paraglaciecola arctica]MBU3002822.1 alanine--glyoxylate aminotransferase family protein [Paraglaciecola arctica]
MTQSFTSFIPPTRVLMGPGPSDVYPKVLEALARPTIGHLDPKFVDLMDQVKQLLQYAFQTDNALTMPISAPGSAGMESVFVNLVEPGDKIVVCQNGVFGGRMQQNVERCGGIAIMVQDDFGKPTDLNKVREVLLANPDAKALAFVHAETSTGVLNDAKALCQIAKEFDCLSIVDAVTSLGGSELQVDKWEIDAIYSGTQKCLSCIPGLSPVSFSEKAIAVIKQRKHPVQSWFLDMDLVMGYWGQGTKRAYHHTAPVNSIYALHESLLILQEEGLQNAWQRHFKNHISLKNGLDKLGLSLLVDEKYRLPQLNMVLIPNGVDDALVRNRLLTEFNLEIGAGLGSLAGKVWRIGLMGCGSSQKNVDYCLSSLETVLN